MKVLWFTNTPCGATEKLTGEKVTGGGWLYALSEAVTAKTDIDLHIAFYWGAEMSPFEYNGISYHPILRKGFNSKAGRYVYRLKQQFSSLLDQEETRRVIAVIKQICPDIVHFHGSEENFGLAAEIIQDTNMVLSIQGMLSPYYYKLYSGYPKSFLLRHEKFLPKILADGIRALDRKMRIRAGREVVIYKYVSNIIGRTSWDMECSLALNKNRRYFICNEILRPEFAASVWRKKNHGKRIVLVTTISHGLYKGLEMIHKTAQLLIQQQIDFEWKVIGVKSSDKIAQFTQKLTHIKPEQAHITLLGSKNASEIIYICKGSDIYVQVSHIENSPNALCEAMQLGMPIIASFAGGTGSMLKDGEEGVLVQDGDPFRLAGAIINMGQNFDQAVSMGRSARARALKRHNPETVVSELISIYHTICNNRS